jgi:hypothetical protein
MFSIREKIIVRCFMDRISKIAGYIEVEGMSAVDAYVTAPS